jgi:hypothetical protein
MSRDSGGILLRGVFAISNWHAKPQGHAAPEKSAPQQNSYCGGGQLLHRVLQIDLPKCRDHMNCASDDICFFDQA